MAKNSVKVGDLVEIKTKNDVLKGILMPRPELFDKNFLILKLNSGYNVGIKKEDIKRIRRIQSLSAKTIQLPPLKRDPKKPTISILHTGGTVASKVDYRTGAVVSRFSPEELVEMFPEIKDIANIKSQLIFQMFSEDIEPEHWSILAKKIEKEIKEKVDGIIITHGTDTLGYTAAALSFMVHDPPIPIILVGAQRSSDRGSSDAAINIIAAANFITKTDFAGVAVCMHASSEDKSCFIHEATKVKKMHTSRRDTFRSINVLPWAKVSYDGKIEFLRSNYPKKENKKVKINTKFEKKIAIVKIRPGFSHKELEFYEKNKYKGLILEGTGLGHAPTNVLDNYTKQHENILKTLQRMSKKMVIVMASQCPYGRINMNVYSSGRDLQVAGIIPAEDMLSETAYVKLGWLLGNNKKIEEVKKQMLTNITGEINKRTVDKAFLY